jgi:hypothetical protein
VQSDVTGGHHGGSPQTTTILTEERACPQVSSLLRAGCNHADAPCRLEENCSGNNIRKRNAALNCSAPFALYPTSAEVTFHVMKVIETDNGYDYGRRLGISPDDEQPKSFGRNAPILRVVRLLMRAVLYICRGPANKLTVLKEIHYNCLILSLSSYNESLESFGPPHTFETVNLLALNR